MPTYPSALILALSLAAPLSAQTTPPELNWSTSLGLADGAFFLNDLAVDDQGNTFATGTRELPGQLFNLDLFVSRFDPQGNLVWVDVFAGAAGGNDRGLAIDVGPDGSAYITGQSVGFDKGLDILTLRYSAAGERLWVERYSHPSDVLDRGVDIAVDAAGRAFVAGYSQTSLFGGTFLYSNLAYGPDGDLLWLANYSNPGPISDALTTAIDLDSDGNPVVTGFDIVGMATVKYDADTGEELWVARLNGFAMAFDLDHDPADNVYVTGSRGTGSSGLALDWVTMRISNAGDIEWVSGYDGPFGELDEAEALVVDAERGQVLVTGYATEVDGDFDFTTIAYALSDGEERWVRASGGPQNALEIAEDVDVDADGNVFIVGDFLIEPGLRRLRLESYAPDGALRFGLSLPEGTGGGSTFGEVVAIGGPDGSILIGGGGPLGAAALSLDTLGCGLPVEPFGSGLAGSGGLVPILDVASCPVPGEPLRLTLANGLGGTVAVLFASLDPASIPLFGGTFFVGLAEAVPFVLALDGPAGTAGSGFAALDLVLPDNANLAGLTFLGQAAVLDAGAIEGVALTSGLEIPIP